MLHKNKLLLYVSSGLFVVAESVLGYFVQVTSGDTCTYVCIASILLACLYVALSFRKESVWLFTQIALLSTVCADSFLTELFTPDNSREIGVLFFCVTQTCYWGRICKFQENKKEKIANCICRFALAAVLMIASALILQEAGNFLSLITMFYFANLVTNLVFACMQTKRSWLFPVGLALFILCDVFVGLSVLESSFLDIPQDSLIHKLNEIGLNMAWVFYVPSQTLIALSVNEKELFQRQN